MSDEFGILTNKEQAFVDAYTEKIRKEERERIIALLEAEKGKQEHMWGIERDAFKDLVEIDWVIELIKGENE